MGLVIHPHRHLHNAVELSFEMDMAIGCPGAIRYGWAGALQNLGR